MPVFLRELCDRLRSLLLRRWLIEPETPVPLPVLPGFLSRLRLALIPPVTSLRSRRRELLIHLGLGLAACCLIIRLVHLQIICHEELTKRASRQQVSEEPVLARPGDLLDRHGRLLATTILVPSLYASPARMGDLPKISQQLAAALQLNPDDLRQRLERFRNKDFIWIKRRLSDEEMVAIRSLDLPPNVVGFRREFQRHYPQGTLAAHLLGIRNIDGNGQGGVEESQNDVLQGMDGIRRFVRDARGYVMSVLDEVTRPPQDGTSVVLTIDALMQLHTEAELDRLMQEHRARGACAIVMNPRNGEILALASRPAFDPNHPETATAADWKNMAIASVFEPGSTFKPMVVAWALDHGVIGRDDLFDCEQGAYRMGRRVLHDHHRYGELSLTDVLVKSSNIGMAKIGERLGNAELFHLAEAFGFGRRTGIELPGELPGLLRPLDSWNSYSTGSIPMGQELAATPLQMISAHATLANRGIRVDPHLVLEHRGADRFTRPVVTSPIVAPEVADWVVQGPLVDVVRRGTGKQAHIDHVEVFGKTGTAQKQNRDRNGYSSTRYLSSFVGGLAANDPQLLVLISVDEPQGADQYGGTVAAPFVAAILQHGMQILSRDGPRDLSRLATDPRPGNAR